MAYSSASEDGKRISIDCIVTLVKAVTWIGIVKDLNDERFIGIESDYDRICTIEIVLISGDKFLINIAGRKHIIAAFYFVNSLPDHGGLIPTDGDTILSRILRVIDTDADVVHGPPFAFCFVDREFAVRVCINSFYIDTLVVLITDIDRDISFRIRNVKSKRDGIIVFVYALDDIVICYSDGSFAL